MNFDRFEESNSFWDGLHATDFSLAPSDSKTVYLLGVISQLDKRIAELESYFKNNS